MDPIAFKLFGIEIAWYGILITGGVLIGAILALREANRTEIGEEAFLDLLIYAVPAAIIGARIYYVAFSWNMYKDNPISIFKFREGGLAIHGAIIAAIIVAIIFARKRKMEFWQLADIAAPSLILGQAIGRWGNFINQEAYGRPTDLPWGIMVNGVKVHPTFLYESLWNMLVFFFLLWFRRRESTKTGEVFSLYLILYSFIRFWIEGLRTDSLMFGPIRVAQLISIIGIIIPGYIIYRRRKDY